MRGELSVTAVCIKLEKRGHLHASEYARLDVMDKVVQLPEHAARGGDGDGNLLLLQFKAVKDRNLNEDDRTTRNGGNTIPCRLRSKSRRD